MEVALATGGLSSEPIYRLLLDELSARRVQGPILEAGAGIGLLTPRLLPYDSALTCVDLLPKPDTLPGNITWTVADLNAPLPFPSETFATIVCTEVVGYLENPHALFREFHRLLRPGGILLLTTPNQESLRSYACLFLEGHFMAFRHNSHPGHITALLRVDFERLCAHAGFSLPRFRYTDDGGLPKFPNVTWQKLFFGLLCGRLFSDNVLVTTTKKISC